MSATLEQELANLVANEDYRLVIRGSDNYLHVRLLYMPRVVVRGQGGLSYIANGVVAEAHWFGRRRWKKASKWVPREIEGHRVLLQTVVQA